MSDQGGEKCGIPTDPCDPGFPAVDKIIDRVEKVEDATCKPYEYWSGPNAEIRHLVSEREGYIGCEDKDLDKNQPTTKAASSAVGMVTRVWSSAGIGFLLCAGMLMQIVV